MIWEYEGRSLPMKKEISEDIHIKSFAGRVAAVDVFCWIHKAAIFSAEKPILGIEASQYVESHKRLNWKLFPFLTSSNSILTGRNGTLFRHFLSQISLVMYEVHRCIYTSQQNVPCYGFWQIFVRRKLRTKIYTGKGENNWKTKQCFVLENLCQAWLVWLIKRNHEEFSNKGMGLSK